MYSKHPSIRHSTAVRRSTAASACLLALVATASCASRDPARETRIAKAIAGEWRSDAAPSDRSGWRKALSVVDGGQAPQPDRLVIHADGRFEATYDAEGFRRLQRILGGDLSNPLTGVWSMQLDWNGAPWLSFEPGAPERRLTMEKGTLMLHSVDTLWPNEPYVRAGTGS